MPIDIKKYRELRRKYLWYMARYKKLSDKQSTLSAYAGDDNDKAKDNLKAYISMLMLGMLQMLGMPEINRERLEGGREGNFPLNITHARMMIDKMGWNSDNWVGATFIAVVVPQNNPQTKTSVKSWSVLRDTIVPPKNKPKK